MPFFSSIKVSCKQDLMILLGQAVNLLGRTSKKLVLESGQSWIEPWSITFGRIVTPIQLPFFPPAGISDHSPVLVTAFSDMLVKKRFCFLNCWTESPLFDDIVKNKWKGPHYGTSRHILFSKMKSLKPALLSLHKANFTNLSQQVQEARIALHVCQSALQSDPLSDSLIHKEQDLMKEFSTLKKAEISMLRQKAKIQSIAERKAQQMIGVIKDKDGILRSGPEDVASAFVDYYSSLLGQATPVEALDKEYIAQRGTVNTEEWHNLQKLVCQAEINEALFSIGSDKSPGPDGFSSEFFKHS
ncbi:uncharacterized protein LOC141641640 [Silene latifolia]|uniref:uncharacterized protein LOC141641640 n=1 Tax=Silene latifolia TaxID=37657 RepID=UPI003D7895C0